MTEKFVGRVRVHDTPMPMESEKSRLGYPADYPINGGDAEAQQRQSELLVGRWHSSMFEARTVGDHVEVWRRGGEVTARDVHDAAARNELGGLHAMNELNRARYGK